MQHMWDPCRRRRAGRRQCRWRRPRRTDDLVVHERWPAHNLAHGIALHVGEATRFRMQELFDPLQRGAPLRVGVLVLVPKGGIVLVAFLLAHGTEGRKGPLELGLRTLHAAKVQAIQVEGDASLHPLRRRDRLRARLGSRGSGVGGRTRGQGTVGGPSRGGGATGGGRACQTCESHSIMTRGTVAPPHAKLQKASTDAIRLGSPLTSVFRMVARLFQVSIEVAMLVAKCR